MCFQVANNIWVDKKSNVWVNEEIGFHISCNNYKFRKEQGDSLRL